LYLNVAFNRYASIGTVLHEHFCNKHLVIILCHWS